MGHAAIFDIDGTLVDSVDLHARAWQEALSRFGHTVTFEQARSQIGKGGDQLIPVFLSEAEQKDHGEEMEEWRGKLFRSKYLPMVRPFSAVPELLQRVHDAGLKVAVASSAKENELGVYLDIARIEALVDVATSSADAEQSKPAPDIFEVALRRLGIEGCEAVAVGDAPYDAEAAGKAGIPTVGMLCGGFAEAALRAAGCVAVYPGPGALLACFGASPLANLCLRPKSSSQDIHGAATARSGG
jgi:HAD superfamily hydrolase (TIGR01509 family)